MVVFRSTQTAYWWRRLNLPSGLNFRLCCVGLVLQRLRLFRQRGCSRGGIFQCRGVLRVASALVIPVHVFQWIAGSSPDGWTGDHPH
jgi:hypothetical protein